MKKFIVSLVLLASVMGFANAGGIGVINNLKVMQDYPEAVTAQKKILSIRQELQAKIKELQTQLVADIKEASDDKAKAQLQQNAMAKFEGEKARFDSLMKDITKRVDDNIQNAINTVAQQKSLDIVVSKNSVYYGGIDITEDVLRQLK